MPLLANWWAGARTRTRPPGRQLWTGCALLVLSVVLLTWAGSSLVTTRAAEPVTLVVAPHDARDARQLVRAVRKVMAPIEAPLAVSTSRVRAVEAAVQAPKDVPEPIWITIPALDIDQDLTELAVIGDALQVPDDYGDIGWWGGGPAPGSPGAGVLVGHVDSPTGPAVFYRLSGLVPGNQIQVRLDDGSRIVFAVEDLAVYDKADFPTAEVYRPDGRPGLNLITCGGSFDTGTQQYLSNVVVSARLVERFPARDSRQPASGRAEQIASEPGAGEGRTQQQAAGPSGPPDAAKDGDRP